MKPILYPAIFHPEEEGYSVYIPDFEQQNYGCYTEGDSFEQACQMAFEAIGLCIEDLMARKLPIPEPSKPEMMRKSENDFIVPIMFDMKKYERQNKSKMVKKTLAIPEWLNELAEKEHINFSETLRVALADQLEISL